jgi:hypothetical protein
VKLVEVAFTAALMLFVAGCGTPTMPDDENYPYPKGHSVSSRHS